MLNSVYEFHQGNTCHQYVNFSSQFTLVVKGESISDNNKSEFFTSRNFSLASQQITSTFSYQYLSTFNASLIYLLAYEMLEGLRTGINTTWNTTNKIFRNRCKITMPRRPQIANSKNCTCRQHDCEGVFLEKDFIGEGNCLSLY
ncbi:MAG: hypothetical protein IPP29_03975 [Bacteroidetes bacterium]|nr:hypothetical protein [Bacteroidota bacterium]